MSKIKKRKGTSLLIPKGSNLNINNFDGRAGSVVTHAGPNYVYSISSGFWEEEQEIEYIQLSPVAITHKKSGRTLVIWIP